ncbi:DUF5309 domain-containing protein [Actinomyces bowdenii]|uniref:DUF5309 domain-containing protein n=1 Tax=Actinomyces bowdenii TaxID=131109 RepID=UPI00214BDD4E|nr:DUF5309 domain-containing protein [Actinomyces bowdenii]MCR2051442.1 DUF5309 domain-containing protein [Actinomyces bowdenii]
MTGITGMGTTYNLPNYVGELFAASPEDTPLLSAIGGLTGGQSISSTLFSWQTYDLRDAEDARQRKEGATAPEADGRARTNAFNVTEIHQEKVEVSYTKQGATKQVSPGEAKVVNLGDSTIPASELAFQIGAQLKQIARDVEKTFITGTFQNPEDGNSPRKTRGLIEAIKTNVATTTHTAANLDENDILDLMQKVWDNGGIQEGGTRTIIVNSTLKRALTRVFIKEAKYEESTRDVGGVNLRFIETDFGSCNIMLNRYAPKDKIIVASLEHLSPVFMEIPGKGHFFAEPLAKTGASDAVQIYGEIGLRYGNEKAHGVLSVAS